MTCEYDEPDPKTYRGIGVRMGIKAEQELFNTGRPYHDYLTAHLVIWKRVGEGMDVMGSSSLDHFVFDGGELPDSAAATEEQLNEAVEAAKAYLKGTGELP